MIDYILLSIIQGLTEFIPVSSSLHLLIFSNILNIQISIFKLTSIHFGSLLALIIYYYRNRNYIIFFNNSSQLLKIILFTSLPIIAIGFLFFSNISNIMQNQKIFLIITTIFFGILLIIVDFLPSNIENDKKINNYKLFFIGFFQCFSLIPGTSRSASIIIGSRILKISPETSIMISYIAAFPVLLGAFTLSVYNYFISKNQILNNESFLSVLIYIISSAIASYLILCLFYNKSKKYGLKIFGFYRVILGIFLIFYYF